MEIIKKSMALLCMFISLVYAQNAKAQDYSDIQVAFTKSYSYEASGNYVSSIEALKKYYDESSYPINIRLGWLNYMAGSYVESLKYYAQCIKLMPYSIEARLGYVLPAFALGNQNQVIAQYKEVISLDNNNYTANYRIGAIYYEQKSYNLAFKHLEKVANMYPFDFDAIHLYAWTNYRLGKLREAKVLFQRALLIRPSDASALEGLKLIK